VNVYDWDAFARKCVQKKIVIALRPDRQKLIPFGTPQEIRRQIKEYADFYHQAGGGATFNIEIENDAPFENVRALIEAVHEFR
jgi:hypothetical protein